ncbi:MAG: MFS transporter [Nocardioides sp.]
MATPRRALAITALGTFVVLAAFTMPLVTVNETAAGLGAGASGRTWILSSMSIGLGAFLLTAGRLADDYGRRRAFVLGSVVLALGALLGAVAPGTATFVLARIVQGIGGAALTAASLGIIGHTFQSPVERSRATAVWGASLGAGIAAGPLLSAGLTRLHSWRDVYVVLLAAAVALAIAGRGLDEYRSDTPTRPDLPGVLALVLGMSALLAGLTEGRQGWASPLVIALLVIGVVLLVAFVVIEDRSTHPMLELALFRIPAFVAVTVAALATGAGVIGLLSYLSGFVGAAYAMSSWTASLLFLAWSATSAVVSIAARRLPDAVTGRARLAGSLLLIGAGLLLLTDLSTSATPARFLPGLLVAGVGSGVLNAALGRESVASVPPHQAGLGSGANNTARYLGSALGVTVVSVLASPSGGATTQALVSGWNRAAVVTAGVSLVGALAVLLVGEPAGGPALDPEVGRSESAPGRRAGASRRRP